jgi:hypothetical protein
MGGPLVGDLRHGGRRGNGIDSGDVAESICDVADGSVAINGKFDAQRDYLLIVVKYSVE